MRPEEINGHSDFLSSYLEQGIYAATGDDDLAQRFGDFILWLAPELMKHADKHNQEEDAKGVSVNEERGLYHNMRIKRDDYARALRVIRTWAYFRDGVALNRPSAVIALIDKTLEDENADEI